MKVFDYYCPECDETIEEFVEHYNTVVFCEVCGKAKVKLVGNTNFKLDGTDPAYATEWDRWAKRHEKAAKVARMKEDE